MGGSLTTAYEQRLVARFRQGDPHAMDALYEQNVDRVYVYARCILGNREDAEEVAAEAFTQAFRHSLDYRGDSGFVGWLFGITRNLCRSRLRQPRLLTMPLRPEDAIVDDTPERAALRADVQGALAELPDDYQDVLVLCDVEDWDAREAARILTRSVDATRSMLYRARRALRERLATRWSEE